MHARDLSTCVFFQKQMFVCIHSSMCVCAMRGCMCMYVHECVCVQPYAYIFSDAMNKEYQAKYETGESGKKNC